MDDVVQLELVQGENFRLDINWEDEDGNPVNISGYTAKMQFRKNAGDPKIYLEATTENGKFTVDGSENVLKLNIPAEEINDLTFRNAEADLFVISPLGESYKLFKANAKLVKRVTS